MGLDKSYHIRYASNGKDTWRVEEYLDAQGRNVFRSWLESLKDPKTSQRIDNHIGRLRRGIFSNSQYIEGSPGLYELVMNFGPGYRAYYARTGKRILLLLCASRKDRQSRSIEAANHYFEDFRTRSGGGER